MQFISNGLFAIHVTDLAKARDFYRDKLGFRLLTESDEQTRLRNRPVQAVCQSR